MWIRSQNIDTIINVINFNAVKSSAGGYKGFIYGHFSGGSLQSNAVIIGKYKTLEEALEEMSSIEKAIIGNPSGVYQIR